MSPTAHPTRARRVFVVAYATAAYLCFLAVFAYAIGFFAGAGVPKGIDDGTRGAALAVVVDLFLLAGFAVQHTVMARRSFKRCLLRIVPAASERATFVLASTLLLALLFWFWRPIDGVVWRAEGLTAAAIWTGYGCGWVLVVGSTFLVSHADLFGLTQARQQLPGRYRPPSFSERGLYRLVRHPLMIGFLVVFWSAPVMSIGHLLFAVAATGYVLVGIAFEERDLVRDLGTVYIDYRARVPALLPRPRRALIIARAGLRK